MDTRNVSKLTLKSPTDEVLSRLTTLGFSRTSPTELVKHYPAGKLTIARNTDGVKGMVMFTTYTLSFQFHSILWSKWNVKAVYVVKPIMAFRRFLDCMARKYSGTLADNRIPPLADIYNTVRQDLVKFSLMYDFGDTPFTIPGELRKVMVPMPMPSAALPPGFCPPHVMCDIIALDVPAPHTDNVRKDGQRPVRTSSGHNLRTPSISSILTPPTERTPMPPPMITPRRPLSGITSEFFPKLSSIGYTMNLSSNLKAVFKYYPYVASGYDNWVVELTLDEPMIEEFRLNLVELYKLGKSSGYYNTVEAILADFSYVYNIPMLDVAQWRSRFLEPVVSAPWPLPPPAPNGTHSFGMMPPVRPVVPWTVPDTATVQLTNKLYQHGYHRTFGFGYSKPISDGIFGIDFSPELGKATIAYEHAGIPTFRTKVFLPIQDAIVTFLRRFRKHCRHQFYKSNRDLALLRLFSEVRRSVIEAARDLSGIDLPEDQFPPEIPVPAKDRAWDITIATLVPLGYTHNPMTNTMSKTYKGTPDTKSYRGTTIEITPNVSVETVLEKRLSKMDYVILQVSNTESDANSPTGVWLNREVEVRNQIRADLQKFRGIVSLSNMLVAPGVGIVTVPSESDPAWNKTCESLMKLGYIYNPDMKVLSKQYGRGLATSFIMTITPVTNIRTMFETQLNSIVPNIVELLPVVCANEQLNEVILKLGCAGTELLSDYTTLFGGWSLAERVAAIPAAMPARETIQKTAFDARMQKNIEGTVNITDWLTLETKLKKLGYREYDNNSNVLAKPYPNNDDPTFTVEIYKYGNVRDIMQRCIRTFNNLFGVSGLLEDYHTLFPIHSQRTRDWNHSVFVLRTRGYTWNKDVGSLVKEYPNIGKVELHEGCDVLKRMCEIISDLESKNLNTTDVMGDFLAVNPDIGAVHTASKMLREAIMAPTPMSHLAEQFEKTVPPGQATPVQETQASRKKEIVDEFAAVINKYSLERPSDTPDFILAEHLYNILEAYHTTTCARTNWYKKPGAIPPPLPPQDAPVPPVQEAPTNIVPH